MTHAAHNGCEAFEGGGPVAAKIDAGLERVDRSVPVRLDEALKYIVARIEMNPRNVDIVTGYLGWDGRGVRTLDELGCTFGLSHEQVKDIVTGAIERMQEARFVPEAVERCLTLLDQLVPILDVELWGACLEAKLCYVKVSGQGLVAAARILKGQSPFEEAAIGQSRALIRTGMTERIEQLAAHARRLVQTRGCAKIDDLIHQFRLIAGASASRRFGEAVARSAGRFEWLDQETRWFWYVPERTFRANPLVNHIRRELGAVSRIELSQLRLEVRPYFETDMSCPPVHVLAAICRRLLFARLEGEVVIGEPNLLARDAVLDQTEATLVRILGVHGPMRGWLSDGRVFVAWRLDKSTLEGGVLRIQEPMSSFIEGDYELTSTRNHKLGSIQIRQRACWDVRPLLRWSSAGVGDTLVLIFDPREQITEGFVGDDLFAAQVLSREVDLHLLIRDVGHDLDRGAENDSAELATSATSAVGERALAAG